MFNQTKLNLFPKVRRLIYLNILVRTEFYKYRLTNFKDKSYFVKIWFSGKQSVFGKHFIHGFLSILTHKKHFPDFGTLHMGPPV